MNKKTLFKKLFSGVAILALLLSQSPLGSLLGTVGIAKADLTSIAITAPNGGEYIRGTTDITWTSDDIGVGLVDIYYCRSTSCSVIIQKTANDGTYAWDTSVRSDGSNYTIRIISAGYELGAGGIEDISNATFTIDNTVPSSNTISINAGDTYTKNATVTLSLSSTDTNTVTQMQFSCADDAYTTAESYATTKSFNITNQEGASCSVGDGTKTVRVRYKDNAGNRSTEISDTIILDTLAPTISFTADVDAGPVTSDTITPSRGDATVRLWRYNDDATCSTSPAGYYYSDAVPMNQNTETYNGKYICMYAADAAGNSTTAVSANDINIDTSGPTSNTISINAGASYANSATATLTLSATDINGMNQMRFSCNNSSRTDAVGYGTSKSFNMTNEAGAGCSVGDGTKTVYVTFSDTLGNRSTPITDTIVLDTTAPTYTINAGVDVGPTKLDTINITVTEANSVNSLTYGFSTDNTCDGSDTYGNSFSSSTNFSIAGDHTDYLCVRAIDVAGNTSYQLVGQLNTDNTAPSTPTISTPITTPANDSTPTLGITVSEANGQSIKIYSGGVLFQTISSPTNGANSITLSDVGEGVHGQFTATFTDQAGNESSSSTLGTFTVDLTAPVVSLTALSPDPTNDNTVTFNGNVIDNLTNIVSVEYSLDGGSAWIAASASDTFNSTSEGYTFTTSALANGSWTVIVRSTDSVGNITTNYATDSFVVDTTTPVIDNLNVTVNSSSSITVAGLATNPGPTKIYDAQYYIDTLGEGSTTALSLSDGTSPRNYNGTIDISGLSNGTHTIYVKVKNEAGTRSTYTSQSFTKVAASDTTAPTLSSPSVTPAKTTAVMSFTSNEAGSAKIAYGLSNSYGNTTQYSTMLASSNTITLAGLSCGTTYHYTIFAKDAAGNENNNLGDATFSTTACDAALEITSLYLSDLGSTSATLHYITDTDPDTAQYRVSTMAYNGTRTSLESPSDADIIPLTSLTAGKTYYYQVRFTKNSQTTTSNPMSFKTASASDGIKVNSIERILNGNTPTPGAGYASGYHFRFDITVNDMSRDTLQFKLSNRSNAASTMAVANNTKIVVSEDGVNVDTDEGAETITAADTYTEEMNIDGLDADDNLGGKQLKVDMFYKIPSGSQGVFSTSYGMQASTTDIPE